MVYQLTYRRPARQDISPVASSSTSQKLGSVDDTDWSARTSTSSNRGIPEALSFDRIVNGGTCPPCTLRDFFNYLKYIEHNVENLQFFLWFKSYCYRFEQLSETEKVLAPEWTYLDADIEQSETPKSIKVSARTAEILKGTALDPIPRTPSQFLGAATSASGPFDTPLQSDETLQSQSARSNANANTNGDTKLLSGLDATKNIQASVQPAYKEAGLTWTPYTIQPFREEVSRIIAIYIANGSPRQLNLSAKERRAVLHALANTTHPSAIREIMHTIESSLRYQAHPNFIRWVICNGNRPRVAFARGLGVGGIVAGVTVGILIALSGAGRAWRVLALIPLFIGISTLIAAWKGMCVVLHGMHHRHLRPWELFQDVEDGSIEMQKDSFDSDVSEASSNSYEDEPWVSKYDERIWIRKIFDREIWVEEPALRQIQDTIFIQSLLGALLGAAVLTAIFVAVPAGHFY